MSKVVISELSNKVNECSVCGDPTCNWHYGAIICEACKKFFLRSKKDEKRKYSCNASKQCVISQSTRANCQYCRYKKCVDVGLDLDKRSTNMGIDDVVKHLECAVCGTKSSGIHFGVVTCEACKGFFRRSGNSQSKGYKCKTNGNCVISSDRSCRHCRYKKCLEVGMSIGNCKMGRTTNKLKHQIVMAKQDNCGKHPLEVDQSISPECVQPAKRMRLQTTDDYTSPDSTYQQNCIQSMKSSQYGYCMPSFDFNQMNYINNSLNYSSGHFYSRVDPYQTSLTSISSFLTNNDKMLCGNYNINNSPVLSFSSASSSSLSSCNSIDSNSCSNLGSSTIQSDQFFYPNDYSNFNFSL